ncbi:radical SAM protein [Synechococcus sp. PCC 7336]|uniref:B12-binding domain-containing radical SAM protein n=1 Tax=Synechococcus sp. PCC 7336 TaxID=195250 RepID=UPI000346893D|nr:radical SAM protein [Synechococcus sp. PCC 7336]
MTIAWTDETLLCSPAPAEVNAIPLTFAFPNTYSIGITSLGYQGVWATLASRSDLEVTRLFLDGSDKRSHPPELLGFSVSWELDYVHILNLLEELGIPIHSDDRTDRHPLIFGGGPVMTANPEPFAEFFDVVLLGDGEDLLHEFIEAYKVVRDRDRLAILRHLAQVPGIYIPTLYEPSYAGPDGGIVACTPKYADVPETVQKRTYRGNTLSTSTVVTPHAAWENIYMVEVVRSCPEMCRFCLASYLTLPFRVASLPQGLIPAIERGLEVTDRIGLLGASVTQHPEFDDLLTYLEGDRFDSIRLSLASVRTGTVTERLASVLTRRGSNSITVAVETGSERLRRVINKKLDNEEIFQAAAAAQAGGLKAIKFYGMTGLPSEESEDLDATVEMFVRLRKVAPKLRYTFGCSTFVPKAHTPFQWYGVDKTSDKKLKALQKQLRPLGVDFRPESYNWSVIQALISRGDRRVGRVLELAREFGESLGSYKRAFKTLKRELPPLDFYVHEDWEIDLPLPWEHLLGPLGRDRLLQHRAAAIAAGKSNDRCVAN